MRERLVRRERSSGRRVPGGGVVSLGASEMGGGAEKGMTGGGGGGLGEVVAETSWLWMGGGVASRLVSWGSGGSETRVDSVDRAGGIWEVVEVVETSVGGGMVG